ncbi:MAG: CBS domain-containing protein [Alistipes shahii]
MTADQIRERVNRQPAQPLPRRRRGISTNSSGVVYLKDLFRHLDRPRHSTSATRCRPAKFFHEGSEVYNALEQLRSEQLGYGIVCDEFGVTRGIVTLKDIFEALVGEIPDALREPDIVRREDGSCTRGRAVSLLRLSRLLRARRRSFPHNAYNTDQRPDSRRSWTHIPATGEKLSLERLHTRDRRHGRRRASTKFWLHSINRNSHENRRHRAG